MKKTLLLLIIVSFALQLNACGGGSGSPVPSTNNNQAPTVPAPGNGNSPEQASVYPDYNSQPIAADATGMPSNAVQLASKIKLGWNIGNTMEAIGGETAWGNPQVSKELLQLVKASGFDAVRIPAAWDQYANQDTAEISQEWLTRIKQVIQDCIDTDLYVVLNIHWDGGWLENNVTLDKQDNNNAKQKAFWQQIATQLRDFDERLLFASANEPNVDNAEQMNVLLSYHQTFIDAVRATGGRNAYRVLVVQGPATDIEKTNQLFTTMPIDSVPARMMAEVHFYTPYNFTLMQNEESWGKPFYYWGENYHSTTDTEHNPTWGEEVTIDELFALMKVQFVDLGIPVVLGEFSATRRTHLSGDDLQLHLASRAYYHQYVVQQALAHGLLPFYWDNGGLDNLSSGLFDRQQNKIFDQQVLDALITGAAN